ncbi:MAG: ATP synthase epsilon chain [uncultured Nocardioidaceae bacterium]|uniref:ATP synthase epsilon chain n=1 Tax=uncultured Nocardioidaceae bacterium TaxID=253824 RepID=A0A6J4LA96_9ACTN|nr:MAG: ATP synthase epsilon chain [uncultured Nocardioidaceae bacterium]
MSDAVLQVEVVSAERLVWSGEASMVRARTTEGELGILPNHAPLLSLLVQGFVDIRASDDESWVVAVDAGFVSVAANRVSILAGRALPSHEIELEKRRQDLERRRATGGDVDDAEEAAEQAWLEAQVRAVEHAS